MSLSDLPKLWTEPTKIGHIFRNIFNKIPIHKKIFLEWLDQFLTMTNDFENKIFEMFEEVVHNFSKSDGDII